MVLSNKKLKQKLRAALVESLEKKESNSDLDHAKPANHDQDSLPQSLKQLLGSATQRPRLSKREKRRKTESFGGGVDKGKKEDEGVEERREKSSFEEEGSGGDERKEETRKKKRKMDEGFENGSLSVEEGGSDVSVKEAKKKKKKKEKKKDEGTENGSLGAEKSGGDVNVKEAKKKNKNGKKKDEGTDNGLGGEEGGDVTVKKAKKKGKKKKKKSKGAKEKEKGEDNVEEDKAVVEHIVAEANSQESEDVARKVYVGGIPYYSSEDDIRSYFEGCGTITEIDCMTFPESGKFRGIAIISFKTEAAAKRALALDGSDMGGLFLKIQPYKATRAAKTSEFIPPVVEGYNRIYIGNLSWDITEDDVKKFFLDCNISSIRFGMDKETGEFWGYAHVDFSDSLSMALALKLNQQVLCGRPVKIVSAIPKEGVKSSTRNVAANIVVGNTNTTVDSNTNTTVDNTTTGSTIGSGKMKRRTCYLCGEKGHISSACSKMPTDASANPDAT